MKYVKASARYLISFLVAGLFLYLAFRDKDFGAVWKTLSKVHWSWIVYLMIGGVLSHLARAWRWQYLLIPVKKNVSLRNSFSAVMIGYMVNNFLPRVGEVVRPYTLGRLESISKTAAFGTVIIERIIDIITFFSILLAVLFFYSNSFAQLFPSFASMEPLFLAGSVVCFALFVLFFFKAEFFFSLFRHVLVFLPEKLRNKIEHLFDSFLSGFAISKYPGQFLMIIVTSYIIWGLYLLLMYLPFYAFDMIGSNALNFGSATVLMVVSTVAFAFPTPSGFGTYHSFTSFALTRLYHVDGVTALSYTILTHEIGVFITTVIGLYYFLRDHIRVTEMVNNAE
jgi:uncharacterized protein (TIRG00374 family)